MSQNKTIESVESVYPVYVFCRDCKKHLCKPCDYKLHVISSTEPSENASSNQARPGSNLEEDDNNALRQEPEESKDHGTEDLKPKFVASERP